MSKKAFTLIELLVVIAIIGLLASMVIVSTRGAILKGKDSQVKSGLAQVKSIAEMIMSDNGNYDRLCNTTDNTLNDGDPVYGANYLAKIENQIRTAQGGTLSLICRRGSVGGDFRYCVGAKLVSDATKCFCVDNKGNAITTSTSATGACDPCDATNYDCDTP